MLSTVEYRWNLASHLERRSGGKGVLLYRDIEIPFGTIGVDRSFFGSSIISGGISRGRRGNGGGVSQHTRIEQKRVGGAAVGSSLQVKMERLNFKCA